MRLSAWSGHERGGVPTGMLPHALWSPTGTRKSAPTGALESPREKRRALVYSLHRGRVDALRGRGRRGYGRAGVWQKGQWEVGQQVSKRGWEREAFEGAMGGYGAESRAEAGRGEQRLEGGAYHWPEAPRREVSRLGVGRDGRAARPGRSGRGGALATGGCRQLAADGLGGVLASDRELCDGGRGRG